MPKSKRNKVVALTKTKKKGKEWKEGLVQQVRQCLDTFPNVYVFRYYNMRNEKFKELRDELQESSRFVMGSTKLLQVALGRTDADEYRTNLHHLSLLLKGQVGLFFTKLPREEAVATVEAFQHEDFARAGAKATETFRLPAGPVVGPTGQPLAHTMETTLRKHGLPTRLNKGVVELLADTMVCKEGKALDPNQAALLRIFDVKMAVFRLKLLAAWSADGDKFEELAEDDGDDDEEEGEDEEGGLMALDGALGGAAGGDGGPGGGGEEDEEEGEEEEGDE